MAKILVEAGIDSISVNADAARKISELVAEIERSRADNQDYSGEMDEAETQALGREHDVLNKEKRKEQSIKKIKIPVRNEDEIDLDENILKALDDDEVDYSPGVEGREEVPSLNEAIPVDSDYFRKSEETENDLEFGDGNSQPDVERIMKDEMAEVEAREGEIEEELEEELRPGKEWRGERKR